jgi:PII-like signaling protein
VTPPADGPKASKSRTESAHRPDEALALALYCGDRDRHGDRPLVDAALGLFAEARLPAAALLRGAEGFGGGLRLGADRLLSLSEDLPLVLLAAGGREQVEALAPRLAELAGDNLLALRAARIAGPGLAEEGNPDERLKLTVFSGRRERRQGLPAHVAVVAALRRHGVDGATALTGVDGVASGRRLRAGFLTANSWVPAVTFAVGGRAAIAAAMAEMGEGEEPPPAIVETLPTMPSGALSRLVVYCEAGRERGAPDLHRELIARLRSERADGATALRGIWGYHGDGEPHGDRLLSLRRRVPVMVEVLDRPDRCRRWHEIALDLTAGRGLATLEHGISRLE